MFKWIILKFYGIVVCKDRFQVLIMPNSRCYWYFPTARVATDVKLQQTSRALDIMEKRNAYYSTNHKGYKCELHLLWNGQVNGFTTPSSGEDTNIDISCTNITFVFTSIVFKSRQKTVINGFWLYMHRYCDIPALFVEKGYWVPWNVSERYITRRSVSWIRVTADWLDHQCSKPADFQGYQKLSFIPFDILYLFGSVYLV